MIANPPGRLTEDGHIRRYRPVAGSQQQAQDQALRQAHQGSPEGRDQPLGGG